MSATWKPVGVLALAFTAVTVLPTIATAAGVANPTFTKDIAPIFQEKCEACHRPDSIAPMSLVTYEEARPVGAVDQDARRVAPDAAVAHRQDRRHPGVQERSLADRRADRHHRQAGSTPARRRATRRTCRRRSSGPTIRAGTSPSMFGQNEPDLIIKSTPWTQKAGAKDAWWQPVVATGITEPRWVRAIEIRPSTVKGRKITHHAIASLQQDETDPLAQNDVDAERRTAGRHVHGMGRRQAGRDDAPEHRQAAAARLEDPLGHPLLERRRRDHRRGRARHLLLPEGPGAEVPPGAAPDGRHQRAAASTFRRTS